MKNSNQITHFAKCSPRERRNRGVKHIFIALNVLLLALFIMLPTANGQNSSSLETAQGQTDEITTLKRGRQLRNPAPKDENLPDAKVTTVSEMIPSSPAAGELDSSFNPIFDGIGFGSARVVVVQPDGKIIVGGFFESLNDTTRVGIVRFNPDGSFDNAFNPIINGVVYAVALQPDGKIVVGGSFTSVNGVSRNQVARLNADGSLDTSFNPGGGANGGTIFAVAVRADGKIIVGGSFSGFNGTNRFNLVRLNADGSIDNTNRTDNTGPVYVIKIQPDGKILIGGSFDLFSTSSVRNLYRLNADYSFDTSFQVSLASTSQVVRDIALQTDGKILIGGQFTAVGGVSRNRIARLNSNGSLDTSFNPGTGTNNTVHSVDVQTNGKILIGGAFSVYDGVDRRSIAQINSDGSLDTSFNPGTGFNGTVFSAKFLANGQIFAGGFFISFNGVSRQVAVRLNADGSLDSSFALAALTNRTRFDFDGDGRADISVFRPSDGVWYLLNFASGFSAAQFGVSSDKIVPADYDGDGKTDIAVYRNGIWYLQRSTAGFISVQFGAPEDIPQPSDFDGDGKAELAVWRPSNGVWYVYNLANNQVAFAQFGASTDKPVAADYDGDGKADYAVFRPSNGTWYVARPTGNPAQNFSATQFGAATDVPVPADYDGDGKTDIAVFRPSNGVWYLLRSSQGFTGIQFGFGTDLPTPADYDGDGKADIAVFRNGTWYLQRSSAGFTGVQFGTPTDKPVPNAFVR